MIRINLLPTKAVVKATTLKTQAIAGLAIILLSLIGVLSWSHSLNGRIEELKGDIAKKQEELKKVEEARQKLDSIKKLNDSLKQKLDVIDNIEKARTGPVWLMDQLTDAITRFHYKDNNTGRVTWRYVDDRVFLKKIDITKNGLSMEGMALNNTYLVAFLNNLKSKSDLFQDVVLEFSKAATYQQAVVRSFKVNCKINLSARPYAGGPTAAPMDAGASPSQQGAQDAPTGANNAQNQPAAAGGR